MLNGSRRDRRHRINLFLSNQLFMFMFVRGTRSSRSRPFHMQRLTIGDLGIRQPQFGD